MSSLMVHNIPTICIDGRISFVSQIPRKEELIAAIQKRINEKLKIRIGSQNRIIRVLGAPSDECTKVRENVKQAITELGSTAVYQEIEDENEIQRHGVTKTPAVAVVKQTLKSEGQVPSVVVIKEWLKQLEE
jgi:uroporphyrinogen decarboxylase